MGYQPVGKSRFQIEPSGTGELIRVKAARRVWPMLFLPVWLAGWTAGGVAAIVAVTNQFEPFLVAWLCGWAIAWVAAAASLIWMFTGSETIQVVNSDLEVAHHMFGVSRRWLYEGGRIRNFRVAQQPAFPSQSQLQIPFVNLGYGGVVKFDYGPRTIHVLGGLDEAEGMIVAERLSQRLPAASRGNISTT